MATARLPSASTHRSRGRSASLSASSTSRTARSAAWRRQQQQHDGLGLTALYGYDVAADVRDAGVSTVYVISRSAAVEMLASRGVRGFADSPPAPASPGYATYGSPSRAGGGGSNGGSPSATRGFAGTLPPLPTLISGGGIMSASESGRLRGGIAAGATTHLPLSPLRATAAAAAASGSSGTLPPHSAGSRGPASPMHFSGRAPTLEVYADDLRDHAATLARVDTVFAPPPEAAVVETETAVKAAHRDYRLRRAYSKWDRQVYSPTMAAVWAQVEAGRRTPLSSSRSGPAPLVPHASTTAVHNAVSLVAASASRDALDDALLSRMYGRTTAEPRLRNTLDAHAWRYREAAITGETRHIRDVPAKLRSSVAFYDYDPPLPVDAHTLRAPVVEREFPLGRRTVNPDAHAFRPPHY